MNIFKLISCRNLLRFENNPNSITYLRNVRAISSLSTINIPPHVITFLYDNSIVHTCQNILIEVHDKFNLSWSSSILCSMLLIRSVVTVPLYVYQQVVLARLHNLRLELDDVKDKIYMEIARNKNLHNWNNKECQSYLSQNMNNEYTQLIIRDNCHPLKASLLSIIQIPIFISLSIALRNLSYPLPNSNEKVIIANQQLISEPFLWIDNLIYPDPYFIMPVSIILCNLMLIEINVIKQITIMSKWKKVILNTIRGLTLVTLPIIAHLPTSITIYWISSSIFGICQNMVLVIPKVRRFCRIPETGYELENPFEYMKQEIVCKFRKQN